MKINYKPKGTCSTDIELEVQDGRIEKVVFKGGCNGNLQGISSLVQRMIAGYLTSENGKKTGRKHKNDLIIFFCRKNLDRLLESVW